MKSLEAGFRSQFAIKRKKAVSEFLAGPVVLGGIRTIEHAAVQTW